MMYIGGSGGVLAQVLYRYKINRMTKGYLDTCAFIELS